MKTVYINLSKDLEMKKIYFKKMIVLAIALSGILSACNGAGSTGESNSTSSNINSTKPSYMTGLSATENSNETYPVIFKTDGSWWGNLGGIEGADQKCSAAPKCVGGTCRAIIGNQNDGKLRDPSDLENWVLLPNQTYNFIDKNTLETTNSSATFDSTTILEDTTVWSGFNSSWGVAENCAGWTIGKDGYDSEIYANIGFNNKKGSCSATDIKNSNGDHWCSAIPYENHFTIRKMDTTLLSSSSSSADSCQTRKLYCAQNYSSITITPESNNISSIYSSQTAYITYNLSTKSELSEITDINVNSNSNLITAIVDSTNCNEAIANGSGDNICQIKVKLAAVDVIWDPTKVAINLKIKATNKFGAPLFAHAPTLDILAQQQPSLSITQEESNITSMLSNQTTYLTYNVSSIKPIREISAVTVTSNYSLIAATIDSNNCNDIVTSTAGTNICQIKVKLVASGSIPAATTVSINLKVDWIEDVGMPMSYSTPSVKISTQAEISVLATNGFNMNANSTKNLTYTVTSYGPVSAVKPAYLTNNNYSHLHTSIISDNCSNLITDFNGVSASCTVVEQIVADDKASPGTYYFNMDLPVSLDGVNYIDITRSSPVMVTVGGHL